jgi:hypothetical protein
MRGLRAAIRGAAYPRPVLKAALLSLMMLVVPLCGCAAPALTGALQVAQFGTTAFTSGTLEAVYPQSFDDTVEAARMMIAELQLSVSVDRPQKGFLYIEADDLAGSSIFFRVKRRTEKITGVSVRVGMLGDQPYSTMIMAQLEKHFQTVPELPQPITPAPRLPQ